MTAEPSNTYEGLEHVGPIADRVLAKLVLEYRECLSSHTFSMTPEQLAEDKRKVSAAFDRMVALATQIGGRDA